MAFTNVPTLRDPLTKQIQALREGLNEFPYPSLYGVLLFGSCAKGTATYRSDIDLLFVIHTKSLRYTEVKKIRDLFDQQFSEFMTPLPVQVNVVSLKVFESVDPGTHQILSESQLLNDFEDVNQRLEAYHDKRPLLSPV